MKCKKAGVVSILIALGTQACASSRHHAPDVRYVASSAAKPYGEAPHAENRRVSIAPDGTKHYVLVLAEGDEVLTALSNFARAEGISNARLQAIGAVREPEVGWFDFERKE